VSEPRVEIDADTLGTLRISGTISYANAADALARLPVRAGANAVDLDLSGLKHADSATLAVLIAWAARVQKLGGELRLRNAPQALRNLAHLSDLDGLLGLA
jgi:phospholipid transport system transporter-binding protein